ncbi:MAG: amidohydrolase family protein [Thermoleophilaceae bacterium]|nr:amidohydrolase family protein [Thermoleophilaceae bacterium]
MRTEGVGRPIDDPGLPIKFGPCSNGEFVPPPLSALESEAIVRARRDCEQNAKRLGISRASFLRSICGAATTLLALQGCASDLGRLLGGRWDLPSEAGLEEEAARAVLAGQEFVFDVQGHFLEYDLMRRSAGEPFFGSVFPQVNCGADDPRACFSREVFLEDMLLRSDTSMVTISALPIAPKGSPLSETIMDEARVTAELVTGWEPVLLHAQVLPNYGRLEANLDMMEENARRYPIAAWKVFTHFPDAFGQPGNAWRLDDADARLPQVGHAFIEKARALGIRIICAHKGFGAGSRYASPDDVPRAAKDFRDVRFIVYHAGFERIGPREGPYTAATANVGINRLITAMKRDGVGPNENVYAELGSTWWTIMRDPEQAAHVLGKLLKHVGEDNVLWGTDCIFYGSPQDQIQTLRAFRISEEFQARFGYPALTPLCKAKILGLNGARVYGVDPTKRSFRFRRRELEQIGQELPFRHETYGPRNRREVERLRASHQGWPG